MAGEWSKGGFSVRNNIRPYAKQNIASGFFANAKQNSLLLEIVFV